jgi:sulfate-transporting ATPase
MLFALPALRTRGLQLAVVTLGLGVAVEAVLFQRGYHSPPPDDPLALLFGDLAKPEGTVVGEQSLFGIGLNKLAHPQAFATLSVLVFAAAAVAVANLRRGRAGRRLIAVRTNERAAASLGVSVVGAKMYAFALSAAIAGFGGVLYTFFVYGATGNIDYGGGVFSPFNSILLIAYAVVGGVGWVSGSFAGATLAVDALGTRLGAFLGELFGGLGWLLRAFAAVLGGLAGHRLGSRFARAVGRAGGRGEGRAGGLAAAGRAGGPAGGLGGGGLGGDGLGGDGLGGDGLGGDGLGGGGTVSGGRAGDGALRLEVRLAPWIGAAALVGLAVAVGPKLAGWLAELERYVPLIGGIVLVAVLSRSDGGIAPENARAARRELDARRPERAAARARRAVAAAVGESAAAVRVPAAEVGESAAREPAAGESAVAVRVPAARVPAARVPAAREPAAVAGGVRERGTAGGVRALGLVRPARLCVSGLTVRFGTVTALEAVALSVDPGEVVGLIGPNGAGKTTAIDAITGYTPAPSAFMTLGGAPIERMPAHRRARAGIARSFQNLELFTDLTVLENIQAACDRRDPPAYLTNLVAPGNRPLPPAALAAVDAFGLRDDLLRTVSELPYGRRRLLAVARAVAAGPSVLLLDEPCAGLDETESAEVVGLLRHLSRDWGLGILLNEHDMAVIMEVCDRIVVLDAGEVIAQGPPGRVRNDPRVRAAYLGDEVASAHRRPPTPPTPPSPASQAGQPSQAGRGPFRSPRRKDRKDWKDRSGQPDGRPRRPDRAERPGRAERPSMPDRPDDADRAGHGVVLPAGGAR